MASLWPKLISAVRQPPLPHLTRSVRRRAASFWRATRKQSKCRATSVPINAPAVTKQSLEGSRLSGTDRPLPVWITSGLPSGSNRLGSALPRTVV